jgi:uncharacterized repeat protein (TIGR01451 family)
MDKKVRTARIAVAKAAAGLAISGAGLLLFLSASAFAAPGGGVGIGVSPNFPSPVTVGQTGLAASMDVTNTSGTTTPITIDSIFLTPSCGDLNVPCTTPDAGVFAVSANATGTGACASTTFTTAVVDPTSGKVQFTPSSTITLAQTAVCTINFTVNVLKLPAADALPGTAGVQTAQGGQVLAHAGDLPGSGTGTNITTVNKVSPTISTTLSTTTPVKTGTSVHDSALLASSTANAGGTATYTVYTNNTCTLGAQSAGVKTVAGAVVPDSDPIIFNTPGTFYWQVVYSGDANNNAATSTCGSEVLVVTANPSTHLTKSANHSSVVVGSSVTYTYHEQNDGDVPLTNASVSDDKCTPVTFVNGDTNANGILDPGETWNYTCTTTLTLRL